MQIVAALCFIFLLGIVGSSNGRGPCGCKPIFVFCANDYTTYHSICEYKCKHPSTQYYDWNILYNGPCLYEPQTTTKRYTTTSYWDTEDLPQNPLNGHYRHYSRGWD